jgi:hypothetical protein
MALFSVYHTNNFTFCILLCWSNYEVLCVMLQTLPTISAVKHELKQILWMTLF